MPADFDRPHESLCPRCARPRAGAPARCPSCGSLERAASCHAHEDRLTTTGCVVCGAPVCPECRQGSRHSALCPVHENVPVIEGWAEAFRSADELEVAWLADTLRASGIDAQVLSQKDRANVVTFGGLSVVRLLVPSARYREAVDRVREELADSRPGRGGRGG